MEPGANQVNIHESWRRILSQEFDKPYFKMLKTELKKRKAEGKVIYPPGDKIFYAFDQCPFDQVKVVIIGQDPYHGPQQAMGLCFSVSKEVKIPPSLKNIYKEIEADLGVQMPNHGDLTGWAQQGVFLLNTVLTVEANAPASHQKLGWNNFTDEVIRLLSQEKQNLVFMLWGNFAKSKINLIDENKHLILSSPHPSPLAGKGFFNQNHFSLANKWLDNKKLTPIKWHEI